jgi:hypothetical protein
MLKMEQQFTNEAETAKDRHNLYTTQVIQCELRGKTEHGKRIHYNNISDKSVWYLLMETLIVPHAADGHIVMITVFPGRVGYLIPVHRCSFKAQSRQMTHNIDPLEYPHLCIHHYIT